MPSWANSLWGADWFLDGWLKEIYVALQNNSPRLAAMGIRALLEHVMISKVGDQGTFVKHVEAFVGAGYLPAKQAESLSAILDAGHATIHRGWQPSDADINTLLDITESILATVYIHTGQVEALRKKVPPNQRWVTKAPVASSRSPGEEA
jgi:hypothetical protein